MNILKIKEFFRGTDCWNCKRKEECLSYQATKNEGHHVFDCTKKL